MPFVGWVAVSQIVVRAHLRERINRFLACSRSLSLTLSLFLRFCGEVFDCWPSDPLWKFWCTLTLVIRVDPPCTSSTVVQALTPSNLGFILDE